MSGRSSSGGLLWLASSLALLGCVEQERPSVDPPGGDPPVGDSAAVEPTPELGEWVTCTLHDGGSVAGELVASYDHRLWWDASEQTTWALFDGDQLGQYPDDASMRFVSSLEIAASRGGPLPSTRPTYVQQLRGRRVLIGGSPLATPALVIAGNGGYHLEENGSGDFAWDLVLTDAAGQRYSGLGTLNAEFLVWDAEVYLPNEGIVVEVVRDEPDNLPGTYVENSLANMVGVHLYGSFYLYILHFQQGSIPLTVLPDAYLPAGTYLGRVGNSGVSLEPHLHMTLLWYDVDAPTPRTWSVPGEFVGLHSAAAPAGPSVWSDYALPVAGTWIADSAF